MPRPYWTLRLMADDMTGALDSAAGFVGTFGPLGVGMRLEDGCPVLDTGTREAGPPDAAAIVSRCAAHLAPAEGRLAFFKVDSLLRGHAGHELAALLGRNRPVRTIVAPALPFQRRITRAGRQLVVQDGSTTPTGEDLAATLRSLGIALSLLAADAAPVSGVSLFDAASDADLDRIVAAGLANPADTLWVGSAGLAAALGRALGQQSLPPPAFEAPLLGLVGSQHPVILQQLAELTDRPVEWPDRPVNEFSDLANRLRTRGHAFIVAKLPDGLCRHAAQAEIAGRFAHIVRSLPPPGVLFVSGGETLRSLMPPLAAASLTVTGEWEPGVPISRLSGGRWDGVTVISKSGAFGTTDLLRRLLATLDLTSLETNQ